MLPTRNIFEPRQVVAERYRQALYQLVDMFVDDLTGADLDSPDRVMDLFQQFTATDAFRAYVTALSQRMVTGIAVEGARTWREAARRSMRGRKIYKALREELQGPVGLTVNRLVEENARLISTFPERFQSRVGNYIKEQAQKGRRADAITEDLLRQFPNITKPRLRLIARTETAKANTALVQARAQEVDADWAVWCTSEDARVRYAHNKMDGIIFSWSELPNPEKLFPQRGVTSVQSYPPGGIYNCRCFPEVLLDLAQVKWPHRIFHGGTIQQMTRARFIQISGFIQEAV